MSKSKYKWISIHLSYKTKYEKNIPNRFHNHERRFFLFTTVIFIGKSEQNLYKPLKWYICMSGTH